MEKLKLDNWLVALDKTEMDDHIIEQVHFWETLLKPKHITYVHIRREPDFWDSVDHSEFDRIIQIERELDDKWIELINKEIKTSGTDTPFTVKVKYGNSFDRVLELCHESKIDLVIAGKKQASESAGTLTEEFARRLPSSFLIIPQTAKNKCQNIMVASDFSDYSSVALNFANEVAKVDAGNITIHAANVYSVPSGYRYLGKTFEEFSADMQKHASKKLSTQLDSLHLQSVKKHLHLKNETHCAKHLSEISKECEADLVIAGAKGVTQTAYTLIGSTSSRMLRYVGSAPLLIVKKPGEEYSFLKALGQIVEPK